MPRILIIEDDITFSQLLEGFLKKHDYEVSIVSKVKEGIKAFEIQTFDIILLDYRLPDGTGMDVLSASHTTHPEIPVVIMTSFHDIRTAVKAMRSGAYDYITKPVNPEELLMVLKDALDQREKTKKLPAKETSEYVEGQSDAAMQIQNYIKLVAPTEMTVIIQGDSGTGKEQVAKTIHNLSKRKDAPFIAIDCGALSNELAGSELFGHIKGAFTGALQNKQGQFEAANKGTLFLDEVGNLSYEVQVKLLRALQEREIQPIGSNKHIKVDVRIITATNDDLSLSVKNGSFREDLYHRLNEFKIKLPTLHERIDDLQLFINHFIAQANRELNKNVQGISTDVRELFYKYDWPGNLRELRNIIKRAVLLAKTSLITMDDLPDEMSYTVQISTNTHDLKEVQATNEKDMILKTLQQVKYNKSKAARLLNIDRKTLYYKMAKYNIEG